MNLKKTVKKKTAKNHSIYLAILIILGLLVRFLVIFQPADRLVQFTGDDMYYYLEIAKNMVEGRGVSFDGIHETNGFHPLYMALLLPITSLAQPDGFLVTQLALIMLSLFNVLTAVFIYKIISLLTKDKDIALLGSFIWLFNPWTIFISLTGVEVAISSFFIGLSLYYYISTREKFTIKNAMILGIMCAFTFLSRSDTVFVFIAIALDIIYQRHHKGIFRFENIKLLAVMGVFFLILISPWLLWSKIYFGTFVQGSAIALTYDNANMGVEGTIKATSFSLAYNIFKFFNYFITAPFLTFFIGIMLASLINKNSGRKHDKINRNQIIISIIFIVILFISLSVKEPVHYPQGITNAIALSSLAIVTCILGFLFGLNLKTSMFSKDSLKRHMIILLPLIMIFLFYALYFRRHQPWYYLSILLFTTILFSVFLKDIFKMENISIKNNILIKKKDIPARKIFIGIFIMLAALFIIRGSILYADGITPWSKDMYTAALYIKENVPPDTKVASFNSGIFSYFSDRTMVNLDGVVNNHLMQKRFDGMSIREYVREQDIRYIVDYPCFLGELRNDLEIEKHIEPELDPFCENSGPIIYKVMK